MQLASTPMKWFLAIAAAACVTGCDPASRTKQSDSEIAFGQALFYDAALSKNATVSCASCHIPQHAFAAGIALPKGASGRAGTRNAPSLLDIEFMTIFFWDGREKDLEVALLQPFTNDMEMDLESLSTLQKRIHDDPRYRAMLLSLYGDPNPSPRRISRALKAFISSRSTSSAFDRYLVDGKLSTYGDDAQAGMILFRGKAGCSQCHLIEGHRPSFTDNRFHYAGIGFEFVSGGVNSESGYLANIPRGTSIGEVILSNPRVAALGRYAITRKGRDLGAFRTPSLRNVAATAPYMHDGSIMTLEQAVEREIYYRSLSQGHPISLTVDERRQLIAFLNSLTSTASPPPHLAHAD